SESSGDSDSSSSSFSESSDDSDSSDSSDSNEPCSDDTVGAVAFRHKQYNRRYSQAWGTTILAGVSFFALGWIIKGGNPLPSFISDHDNNPKPRSNDRASLMSVEICRFRYGKTKPHRSSRRCIGGGQK
ncbi:hypothetical protein LINPERHAP1_LOCUS11315, partial [Linum perenne]